MPSVFFACNLEEKSALGIYQRIESMKKEDFGDVTIQLMKKPNGTSDYFLL